METGHDDDEYYLITLQNGEAFLSLDRTRDHQAVLDKLTHVNPHGTTALYDACSLGLQKVMGGTRARRALLLISDGQDNSSRHTLDELRQMFKESDCVAYSIGVAETGNDDLTLHGEEVLTDIAKMTGGKFFQPKTAAEMYRDFERIALELRHQYAIGYRPSNFATNGKWHHIKVKVDQPTGSPRLFIRYRNGYYASEKPRSNEP
jgi:Ca-activated chloride channel family protein